MVQYTSQSLLSNPTFIVHATLESIDILAKHVNEKPEDVLLAFINRTPNVVDRVQEIVIGSSKALADKMNQDQEASNA
jgi:hypothetical protein